MAASPKFLFGFLFFTIILWLLIKFASRLLAWILGRVLGASIGFRVSGWKSLRDITVKFKKGPIESVSVGEIRLSLRKSLAKIGVGFLSRDPKIQVLISDLEVVMSASSKGPQKSRSRRSRSSGKKSSGKGKWMVVANVARFISISLTDFVVKTPKANIEVKEVALDISKESGARSSVFVKLHILPIVAHLPEPRASIDQSSSSAMTASPFSCEEFSFSCEFGPDRDGGIAIKDIDIAIGVVSVNLNEQLLLKNKSSSEASSRPDEVVPAVEPEKKPLALVVSKFLPMIPEKFCFKLPKLDVNFEHLEHKLAVRNDIMGIQLKSNKSYCNDDVGESTRLDIQLEFSEIHLLKETGTSVMEILKLDVVSSVYIPLQPTLPLRCEVDVKLGGTKCNILMGRIKPWMQLKSSNNKKKMVLQDESTNTKKKPQQQPSDSKPLMWTFTVSAPEMTIVLYNMSNLPLYHFCSQSSHVYANNIASTGTSVHAELGELNLHMADEYQCLKETLFGVETNTGSLLHVAKISVDWGKKDTGSSDDDKYKLALSVDVSGMGVFLTFKRIESLVATAFTFKALLKSSSSSGKKPAASSRSRSTKPSGKGTRLLKFNIERCSLSFSGEVGVDNTIVMDPKRANYGSQGGRFVVTHSPDGTPRTANIISTISDECKTLSYCVTLDIFHLSLSMNKDKQSTQVDLQRARSVYQEYSLNDTPGAKLAFFDIQNAKLVRRAGGHKEIAVCSLFSATDITLKWEPDMHIALFELGMRMKLLMQTQKLQGVDNEPTEGSIEVEQKKVIPPEPVQAEKPQKKKESVFAIDVEMLSIYAEAGDGVDVMVQVQSIFSENARIGVLLEGLALSFCDARVLTSGRMQISRIPKVSNSPEGKITIWDYVIQAIDIHIGLPFRVQLRAIDDAVEDQLRVLKLITDSKAKLIFPIKKESKPKKPSSNKFGCVKFCVRKITADIEEEPLQGWLDEHYELMKNEAREVAVRLKFLDELISKGKLQSSEGEEANEAAAPQGKFSYNGEEIDVQDAAAIKRLQEEIHKQSFRSYYQACQKIKMSDGSGACKEGYQSGFKLSNSRSSCMSIIATDLDLTLTKIEGGEAGMIELLQKLDPVALEYKIPFSRLYGTNLALNAGSLSVLLRNYTLPLFDATSGRCEGRLVMAQQATPFQPQMHANVYIGKSRRVRMLRSATGTTPPMKTYFDLPLHFQKAEISFGVGHEPVLADVSYAFTVAMRRANLSIRNPNPDVPLPRKEKSLPWWDEMRNYIHGNINLYLAETKWYILATTDPYEKSNTLVITSGNMEIQQSDGRIYMSANDFKILVSSLQYLPNRGLKPPLDTCYAFLEAPSFTVEVTMEWGCESGAPLNHYLFALPEEGKPRDFIYDPFRSTALSLCFSILLRPPTCRMQSGSSTVGGPPVVDGASVNTQLVSNESPTINVGPHDFAWLSKFGTLMYLPPHKLRLFSRFPRFGVPRILRSGNLSLDRVMTEFMFRLDSTPFCLRNIPLDEDDPSKGLTFKMSKLKLEIYFGRGKQKFTFDCKREPLDLVYQGIDLHVPKVYIDKENCPTIAKKVVQMKKKNSKSASMDKMANDKTTETKERHRDDGFLLSSDYFTIRKQAPKADPARLVAWQEAGRRNSEMTYVRSEFENGSDSDEHNRSDPSDDDGYNVVIADNCQRIFVYGLKLLWNIENRDAVWSWVGGLSKAFQPAKPSPSRQYARRKLLDEKEAADKPETQQDEASKSAASTTTTQAASASTPSTTQPAAASETAPSTSTADASASSSSTQPTETSGPVASSSAKSENQSFSAAEKRSSMDDSEEGGNRHFMVNVIEPQFNLHSEEANGRFLLAAVSGRILARSFHSVVQVGADMIKKGLGSINENDPENQPELTWNRSELSVMLEHVQAHVAPTDVDPGAGVQWLPKIRRSSPKVKRTGALLERVFMPCDMYFRYTRHKGTNADLKVKPLKELTFNSHNITATMTSRQFQVMVDVLTNLLLARLPKPRKSSLSYPAAEDDEDVEEEADEVVPDGVEEVELARIGLEQKERVLNMLLDDIRKLSAGLDISVENLPEKEGDLYMISGGRLILVQRLKKELGGAQKSRKNASGSLRLALQKAAQQRLMEKEKNKSPSYAMRISMQINKVVWGMLVDGKSFAEAEINDMIYDFDRDYKDIGIAKFTTKSIIVRNCLPNAKSDTLLSAWNPPPEWGKNVMLRVDAKQGAPKEGNSPLELFQVEIYPLKIHLTEAMYRMMWGYLFPVEEQDSQRRQEAWKVSTTAGSKRVKKVGSLQEGATSAIKSAKIPDFTLKPGGLTLPFTFGASLAAITADSSQSSKSKGNVSSPQLKRSSSFDRTWEENVAETVANELVLQAQSSASKSGPLGFMDDKAKSGKSGVASSQDLVVTDKSGRPKKLREFHNIKISQVELLVTYEGSRFAVSDLRLLMDTFHRDEFIGTWRRLFSRVKKHIIWGVLKSVTGMQGKKFKDKLQGTKEPTPTIIPDTELTLSDSDGEGGKDENAAIVWPKRPADGAGDGFVTSVRGLFSTQRRKAKAFVLRTMRGDGENELQPGDWSESDAEFSPFARQLTITKAKKLIRRHTKKFRSRKGSTAQEAEDLAMSPRESGFASDSSSETSPYEEGRQ
jgi:hypothetical protein